jgi:23S rRNA (adenine2503-C2)-methyltransferase
MVCYVVQVNPTKGFNGRPSDNKSVQRVLSILQNEYGIPATVRVRRGIDVDAGCGQLASVVEKRRREEEAEGEAV